MGYSDRRAKVAAEVRAELARQGKNPSALSAAIGMSSYTLRRRLNGVYPFHAEELLDICDFLGISMAELVARTEDAA